MIQHNHSNPLVSALTSSNELEIYFSENAFTMITHNEEDDEQ